MGKSTINGHFQCLPEGKYPYYRNLFSCELSASNTSQNDVLRSLPPPAWNRLEPVRFPVERWQFPVELWKITVFNQSIQDNTSISGWWF